MLRKSRRGRRDQILPLLLQWKQNRVGLVGQCAEVSTSIEEQLELEEEFYCVRFKHLGLAKIGAACVTETDPVR